MTTLAADTVTLSSKGQVAIPKEVRDLLNLSEGIRLHFEVKGNSVIFSKLEDWRSLRENLQLEGDSLTDALLAERARDKDLEDNK